MTLHDYVVLMSRYNEWMNVKIYAAAANLTPEEFNADQGAFFGSVCGTLNHLVVGDTIWLKRFAIHPAAQAALEPTHKLTMPTALDQIVHTDLAPLSAHRKMLDSIIKAWADALTDDDLNRVLHYANTKGIEFERAYASLVLHFFNHQTHHRGQVTCLLTQLGQDVGVTDLVALIPNQLAH